MYPSSPKGSTRYMKNDVIYDFDKIILIDPNPPAKNAQQACYGMIPRASYRPGALKNILENRFENKRIILRAAGDERVIKEALWVLGACGYFDKIVIEGEGEER